MKKVLTRFSTIQRTSLIDRLPIVLFSSLNHGRQFSSGDLAFARGRKISNQLHQFPFNECSPVRSFASFTTAEDPNPNVLPVGVSLNQKDYTNNAFEALANIVTLAELYRVPQIESELLLKSLLELGVDGLPHRILTKSKQPVVVIWS